AMIIHRAALSRGMQIHRNTFKFEGNLIQVNINCKAKDGRDRVDRIYPCRPLRASHKKEDRNVEYQNPNSESLMDLPIPHAANEGACP
ncbi:MAG: hypothetical protein P8Z73_11285, partial [Desulfobacteraceae bacterium]